jgi:hypothetical protein
LQRDLRSRVAKLPLLQKALESHARSQTMEQRLAGILAVLGYKLDEAAGEWRHGQGPMIEDWRVSDLKKLFAIRDEADLVAFIDAAGKNRGREEAQQAMRDVIGV